MSVEKDVSCPARLRSSLDRFVLEEPRLIQDVPLGASSPGNGESSSVLLFTMSTILSSSRSSNSRTVWMKRRIMRRTGITDESRCSERPPKEATPLPSTWCGMTTILKARWTPRWWRLDHSETFTVDHVTFEKIRWQYSSDCIGPASVLRTQLRLEGPSWLTTRMALRIDISSERIGCMKESRSWPSLTRMMWSWRSKGTSASISFHSARLRRNTR
mmetsp:Transcript_50463/g.118766  ORF Transcript_50463/g.118766 Transcript_50463/m.118766 type:complete len:216 (+) Transcript_50463:924-1571(+)